MNMDNLKKFAINVSLAKKEAKEKEERKRKLEREHQEMIQAWRDKPWWCEG